MKAKKKSEWIYGKHAVVSALQNAMRNPIRIVAIAEMADWIKTLNPKLKVEKMDHQGIDQLVGSRAVHQGIAMLAEKKELLCVDDLLENLESQKNITIAVLDQVTDPQNIGSILRAAAAFNIDALLMPDAGTPEITSTVIKVAAGGYEHVPVIKISNLARTLEKLKKEGFWVMGFAEKSKDMLTTYEFDQKSVIVFGAEGQGMRRLTKETCDVLLTLPTTENFTTLNVAQAAAITFYEIFRQKKAS